MPTSKTEVARSSLSSKTSRTFFSSFCPPPALLQSLKPHTSTSVMDVSFTSFNEVFVAANFPLKALELVRRNALVVFDRKSEKIATTVARIGLDMRHDLIMLLFQELVLYDISISIANVT
mmetsp:Transcript_37013/g.86393  ORF Transcript_37013/g.86393 Transcript_37013/m.86393 type:complete len:120 (+) Transcript_37013:988-1347(+)